MMRFYGLSDRQCLQMPIGRLILLYTEITPLEAEEDLRRLTIQYTANPRDYGHALQSTIEADGSTAPGPDANEKAMAVVPGLAGYEGQGGEIDAIRQRQRESAARIEREWREQQAAQRDSHDRLPLPTSTEG